MSQEEVSGFEKLSFAAVSERFEDLLIGIRAQLEELATLEPVLKAKAKDLGLSIEVDYALLKASLAQLNAAPAPRARGRRSKVEAPTRQRNKDFRYKLVWRDGSAVVGTDGKELVFRNQVRMLRGPKYDAILSERLGEARLLDTVTGEIVVDSLSQGPAPGGRRRRA